MRLFFNRSVRNSTFNSCHPAFTLVELVVVIGIIGLLIGILIPALSSARVSARRTQDLNNIRQITLSCVAYATENDGFLPLGDRTGSKLASNNDDLVWVNQFTFGLFLNRMTDPQVASSWVAGKPLDRKYQSALICNSLANYEGALDYVGLQTYRTDTNGGTTTDGGETYMGYIYWGRRNISRAGAIYNNAGTAVSPATNYVFPKKYGVNTATSQTLITCPAWVGPSYGGQFPHTGFGENLLDVGNQSSPAASVSKAMIGICVGYTDGSARFAPRSDLWAMWQGFEWIYYDHNGQ